jgi:hypothetical protein
MGLDRRGSREEDRKEQPVTIARIPEQVLHWKLTYARNPFLYFVNPEDYDTVTGDDWDDAPYQYNAGPPSKPCYVIAVRGLYEPAAHFSVDDIRAGRGWFLEYGYGDHIPAGITLSEMLRIAEAENLPVYIPL